MNRPDLQVTVAWFERRYPTGTTERRYVLCNQPLSARTLIKWGRQRWAIESFFKTAKGRFGLDQFGQRTLRGVIRFLFLSLLAWILSFLSSEQSERVEDWGHRAVLAARVLLHWVVVSEFLMLQDQLFSPSRPYFLSAHG